MCRTSVSDMELDPKTNYQLNVQSPFVFIKTFLIIVHTISRCWLMENGHSNLFLQLMQSFSYTWFSGLKFIMFFFFREYGMGSCTILLMSISGWFLMVTMYQMNANMDHCHLNVTRDGSRVRLLLMTHW